MNTLTEPWQIRGPCIWTATGHLVCGQVSEDAGQHIVALHNLALDCATVRDNCQHYPDPEPRRTPIEPSGDYPAGLRGGFEQRDWEERHR